MAECDYKNRPSYPKIILARHAKSKHNIYDGKGTFAGYRVNSELTDEGKREALLVAQKIIAQGGCSEIFYSDQIRSKQTAEIVESVVRKANGCEIPMIEVADLHEVDVGEFTLRTEDWVREKYPVEADSFYDGRIWDWEFPGGENYQKIATRVMRVVEMVVKSVKPQDTALLIGHGMFNRVFLHLYDPNNPKLWRAGFYPHDLLIDIDLSKFSILNR